MNFTNLLLKKIGFCFVIKFSFVKIYYKILKIHSIFLKSFHVFVNPIEFSLSETYEEYNKISSRTLFHGNWPMAVVFKKTFSLKKNIFLVLKNISTRKICNSKRKFVFIPTTTKKFCKSWSHIKCPNVISFISLCFRSFYWLNVFSVHFCRLSICFALTLLHVWFDPLAIHGRFVDPAVKTCDC